MVMWDRPPLLPGEIAMRFGSAKQVGVIIIYDNIRSSSIIIACNNCEATG